MSKADLFRVFSGLPRQGPGSTASTKRAINLLPALPANPRILDLGCGTGAQTRVLADEIGGRITAIDIYQPFLDSLAEADARIETRCTSMASLDYRARSVDLIWSEGAIYLLGVELALKLWRRLLKARGVVAFTEVSWLQENPPAEIREFWNEMYPEMATVATNCARARQAGYKVLGHFALPPEDWWQDYYLPLLKRCKELSAEAVTNDGLREVLAGALAEIEIFSQYSEAYSYVFYVVQK